MPCRHVSSHFLVVPCARIFLCCSRSHLPSLRQRLSFEWANTRASSEHNEGILKITNVCVYKPTPLFFFQVSEERKEWHWSIRRPTVRVLGPTWSPDSKATKSPPSVGPLRWHFQKAAWTAWCSHPAVLTREEGRLTKLDCVISSSSANGSLHKENI